MTSVQRFRNGLVIGKFYPPHAGHHYLIETALAQCERLFVMVCHHPRQTIPGEVRVACLQEVHPAARVVLVADDLPDDDSAAWAEKTRSALGLTPDAVFTSEDYGTPYARCLGPDTVHVLVDRERRTVPCSGTLIRGAPLDHLHLVSAAMRAWYVRRVCLLGAESTGKTTLAEALAAHYHTTWVPEYGREYCEKNWYEGYPWDTSEFTHIAREQARREDLAARQANRVLICDTDPLATSIWHERYLRHPSPDVLAIARARRYDLYILAGDQIPFVQDGWRDGEHVRHAMHQRFAEVLAGWGTPWYEARGSLAKRLAAAVARVDAVLASMRVS